MGDEALDTETTKSIEDLAKLREAEARLLQAEANLLTAKKTALAASSGNADGLTAKQKLIELDAKLAELKSKQATADAAVANARYSEQNAALSMLPTGSITGKANVEVGAGELESSLLSTHAVKSAAEQIFREISDTIEEKKIVLLRNSDANPTVSLFAVKAIRQNIAQAHQVVAQAVNINAAEKLVTTVSQTLGGRKKSTELFSLDPISLPAIATLGLALDAGSRIFSNFKSDFSLGGISLDKNDDLVASVLAGVCPRPVATLHSLALALNDSKLEELVLFFQEEAKIASENSTKIDMLDTKIGQLRLEVRHSSLDGLQKSQSSSMLDQAAALVSGARKSLTRYSEAISEYVNKLTDPESPVYINKMVLALAFDQYCNRGNVCFLRFNVSFFGGSYHTKQSLWSGVFGAPIKFSGGVIMAYELVDPSSGEILRAGSRSIHGGFESIQAIRQQF